MKPIIGITGANGFIGQSLIKYLTYRGIKVVVVVRDKSSIKDAAWFACVKPIEVDIFKDTINLKKEGVDVLLHLAWGQLDNYSSKEHYKYALDSRAFISHQIKNGLKHIAVSGTCQEYGIKFGPIKPSEETDPQTAYARAKVELYNKLNKLCKTNKVSLCWARIFYTYGEGQSEKQIMSKLKKAIDNKEKWFDMSMGDQLRDYLPVEKVSEKLSDLLLKKADGIFNIGSNKPISIRRLVTEYAEARGSSIKFRYGIYPYPEYESMAFWAG